jgi:nicotinate-nucleotide adenylyltransferase
MENYRFYVYPRVLTSQEEEEVVAIGRKTENLFHLNENIIICEDAPVMKVSSSFIRNAIKNGKDVRYLLTDPVHKYIDEMNFYR